MRETVERIKQLRREMCDVVSREILSKTRNHGECEEKGREVERREECVLVKYVRWKGNKLVVVKFRS